MRIRAPHDDALPAPAQAPTPAAAPSSFEAGHLMAQSLGGASDATNLVPIGGGAQTASSPQSATPAPAPQAAGGFEWGHMAAGGLGGPAQPGNLVSASAQSNNQQAVVEDQVRKKLGA